MRLPIRAICSENRCYGHSEVLFLALLTHARRTAWSALDPGILGSLLNLTLISVVVNRGLDGSRAVWRAPLPPLPGWRMLTSPAIWDVPRASHYEVHQQHDTGR